MTHEFLSFLREGEHNQGVSLVEGCGDSRGFAGPVACMGGALGTGASNAGAHLGTATTNGKDSASFCQ